MNELITYSEAKSIIFDHLYQPTIESIPLQQATGRIVAKDISADRDDPPFHRATKDGIAISFSEYEAGRRTFPITGIAKAGSPQLELNNQGQCIEIMTGAVVPKGTDTVVMVEQVAIEGQKATISGNISAFSHIQNKGSFHQTGDCLIPKHQFISPAEIGVLASIGCASVPVLSLPKVAIISTGDELVSIDSKPKPFQIRRSNAWTLFSALQEFGIQADMLHFKDEKSKIETKLNQAVNQYDVLLLSGGVSKGKFDFLPESFATAGLTIQFHGVQQRPGKPLLFATSTSQNCTVFSFPGNPASTFSCFQIYFRPWLNLSFYQSVEPQFAELSHAFSNHSNFTRFILATIHHRNTTQMATIADNGQSGDYAKLTHSNALLILENKEYSKGDSVPFIAYKPLSKH